MNIRSAWKQLLFAAVIVLQPSCIRNNELNPGAPICVQNRCSETHDAGGVSKDALPPSDTIADLPTGTDLDFGPPVDSVDAQPPDTLFDAIDGPPPQLDSSIDLLVDTVSPDTFAVGGTTAVSPTSLTIAPSVNHISSAAIDATSLYFLLDTPSQGYILRSMELASSTFATHPVQTPLAGSLALDPSGQELWHTYRQGTDLKIDRYTLTGSLAFSKTETVTNWPAGLSAEVLATAPWGSASFMVLLPKVAAGYDLHLLNNTTPLSRSGAIPIAASSTAVLASLAEHDGELWIAAPGLTGFTFIWPAKIADTAYTTLGQASLHGLSSTTDASGEYLWTFQQDATPTRVLQLTTTTETIYQSYELPMGGTEDIGWTFTTATRVYLVEKQTKVSKGELRLFYFDRP